jgi:hypothetical protein
MFIQFPLLTQGPDRVYIKGYPVTLSAAASGEDISFNWDPVLYMDDATLMQPTVTPPEDITYILSVLSAFNCSNKDRCNVRVVDGIYVPQHLHQTVTEKMIAGAFLFWILVLAQR